MTSADRIDHDHLYHWLFSDPRVVAQLLRDFVAGAPDGPAAPDAFDLAAFDLDGIERLNADFHARIGRHREGDMIWRLPRRDGTDAYLLLLLEFQSTSEHFMALRVMTYAGLLWELLVAENRLVAGGGLPPLLPVVLYNGDGGWRAPLALRDLVALRENSPLWRWQPDLRYILIDVGAFTAADLRGRDSLLALWFRLENARGPRALSDELDSVLAWFGAHPEFAAMREIFARFLAALMAPLEPAFQIPEELLMIQNVAAKRMERWVAEFKQEQMREGRAQGLELGRQEGRREGRQEGRREGLQEGLQEGLREGEALMLTRLLQRRFGHLPEAVKERVQAADIMALEQWGLRILDAESLEAVFADRPV